MTKGRVAPEQPVRLQFEIPGPSEPGFLRRQREAVKYREALRNNPSVQTMDDMITFLLGFVVEPTDKEQARELLLDLSRDDYNRTLAAVNQEDPDFLGDSLRSVPSSRSS